MAINFPDSPTINDTYTISNRTWIWTGTVWNLLGTIGPPGPTNDYVNGITAGTGVTVSGTPAQGWSPTVSIGQSVSTSSSPSFSDLTLSGDAAINGGDVTTTSATFNLVNSNTTTVNFAGAATIINVGKASGIVNFAHDIDVSGDISVTGTVDGRDIAADGTKLDGIESGATADQTAAEILTAIKTVDGDGSGLDADTLDGQHASDFEPAGTTASHAADSDIHVVAGSIDGQVATWNSSTGAWEPQTPSSGVTDHSLLTGLSEDDHTQYLLADGSRTLSGNLSVTGTVDGRDIAADGTKLDGIESGAQVNTVDSVNSQTGAVVLDADDIDDTSTTNKFTTASDISKLAGIESGATADQLASDVPVSPTGNLASTDVQAALQELQGDIDTLSTLSAPDNVIMGNYSGSVPSNAVGNDGDYAIDISDGSVYGPKASGVWPSVAIGDFIVATNLGNTRTSSAVTITSSDGTDTTISAADSTNAGVMTASDYSKLLGIEAGATADMTASEILTAIKTVDGSGTGLDADLLDGQHGTYYQQASTALTTSTTFGGDVSGTYNNIVIADDSHSHVISNVDGLQTALDGLETYVQSRADDLVTNGYGITGDNTNFSQFTFDNSDTYAGKGAFYSTSTGSYITREVDEIIPVDFSSQYQFSYWVKQISKDPVSLVKRIYGMTTAFDAVGSGIQAYDVYKYPGSTYTSLAADLNNGDTTITLTDATGWANVGSQQHQRFIAFPYTDSRGFTYPAYTYSKNNSFSLGSSVFPRVSGTDYGTWAAGSISGNVITLAGPYNGPTIPAGTKCWNAQSAGTFDYIAGANSIVTDDWSNFTGKQGGGSLYDIPVEGDIVGSGSDAYMSSGVLGSLGFRWGTAFVRLGWLLHRGDVSGEVEDTQAISAVSFRRLPDSNPVYESVTLLGDTTIAATTFENGLLKIGTSSNGWTIDGNELYNTGNATIGSLSGGTLQFANIPAFNGGVSGSTAPFTVDSNYVVANLNADLLDGQEGSYYQPASTALTTSTSFGGDVSGTYDNIIISDDSHNHDGRYYTEAESDSLFVNVSGDTMSGNLIFGSHSYTPGIYHTNTSAISIKSNGQTAFTNASSDTGLGYYSANMPSGAVISPISTAYNALIVKGVASQSANLQEWRNSSGTALATMSANGNFAAATKSFDIPHPTKDNMRLRYGSVEAPEHSVQVRGRCSSGVIVLPDYWEGLVDDSTITVQLTAMGRWQRLFVKSFSSREVVVGGSRGKDFFYTVSAERKDVPRLVVEYGD